MIIIKEAAALSKYIQQQNSKQNKIGFVPTMGALHEGHISLIKNSLLKADVTVSSIFVNPTQFNDPKDFDKYPVNISNDVLLLVQAGCDVLFLPAVNEVYPDGLASAIHYDLGQLETILEGRYRPGHFQGVCQVVHRLLDIVKPDFLFLGQKDYQQYLIIKLLVASYNIPVEVLTAPTYREATGLAMSSRNLRLSDDEKERATAIYKMLLYIKEHYRTTEASKLESFASGYLLSNGFAKVEYVAIADAEALLPVNKVDTAKYAMALIAAYMGDVRLIDNIVIS